MSDTKPHWRMPDDTSDELYVGDRIIAICQWCGHDGRTPETHVIMLTIDEDGVTRDKEGIWYTLQDCDYWIPESEFLRMFGPEVQADTPPDAPPWQGQDGWEGKR